MKKTVSDELWFLALGIILLTGSINVIRSSDTFNVLPFLGYGLLIGSILLLSNAAKTYIKNRKSK